jgi:PAS domain S-box-containing protein
MGSEIHMMRRSFEILFGLCLLLACHWAPAYAALPECDLPDSGLSLSSSLSTLIDPDLTLDLATARKHYLNGEFQPHGKGTPSFGFVRGALWARVQIPAVAETCASLFVIEQPRINTIELFVLRHNGSVELLKLGTELPFASRSIPHRFLNARIVREAGEPLELFLKVQSASSVQLPVHLYSESSLFRHAHNEQAGMGIYYGILLALFLYGIAVMIGIRDDNYFYYVIYLAALCLFSLSFTGHGYQYLWPDSPYWQVLSLPLSLGALLICGGSFAYGFLDLARLAPRLGWSLRVTIVLAVPAALAGALPLGMTPSTLALTALLMPGSVLITLGAIVSAMRGYRPAYYFLFAWCLQLLGGIAIPLSAFGWIPRTVATEYGLQFGSAAEMLLLSFALTYRINLLREQKDKAEREAEREAGRRQLEDSLKRSLDERNAILENSMVPIILLNADGRTQWANQAMYRVFGAEPGDYLGKSIESFYPSREEYLKVGAAVAMAISRGEGYEEERLMKRKDGRLIWTHISGRAINPTDTSQGTVWVAIDVTHRHELEDKLRRTTAEQEIILQSTQIGITYTKGRVHQWVNQTFASMLGFPVEELIGHSTSIHFPDEASWRNLGEEAFAQISTGESFAGERYFKRKSGEIFPVQMFGKSLDSKDPGKGAIWTVVDLTERRRLEDEVRRTSLEREVILQNTQIGITLSVNRHHRWFNRTFADMMGFSDDELLGASSRIHFPDDEAWARLGAEAYPVLGRGEPYASECQMRRKDGELIWIQLFGKAVDAGDMARGAIWTFVDVTQRHRAEEDIRRALTQQVELSELKSKFVSMTSHEFRTPLAIILSSSELLRHYSDRLSADEKVEVLGSIDTAVKRMAKMLDGILMIGRADSGNLEFRPAACQLRQLCTSLADETARTANADGSGLLRLDVRFAGTEVAAMLDESLMRHILGNLIGNAFKYSPAGGRVGLSIVSDAKEIIIEVSDQGIGIPSSDIPKLFETFHRAGNVGNIAGTGLGLAIVRRAVELHGGKIEVDSRLGEGTRFTVRLPLVEA